ncbi:LysR family transcriptional regulator [Enterovibrio paralichthyis]|uniref:LysR family transcriptional regulator n=1 Tax=Enterovibrio paralichthyis TaxID=2853805 RepID=UPI001C4513DD|nr:LysR family transcriptional regulator [Enterovibrio paralichthyis]MBV7297386.1 LysR family transcriptional regulator [Enterovibrio paralichthyis]
MQINDLRVVLKVAEFRSITAAATHLDMQTATASAAVKRVEQALGLELFVRTTRSLRLSNAGERYLPQCEQALQLLDQANRIVKDELDIIDGELRLAVSSDLGRNVVLPWLDEFMDAHPAVSLRANVSDSNVDFYRDAIDIALRYGSPGDANVYGFKICDVPRLLCASPEYLEKHGEPTHPQEVARHNALLFQLSDMLHDVWDFDDGTNKLKVRVRGNRASNDADLVRRWCVAGKGVAAKSALDMAADLLSGRIVSLLSDYPPIMTELWLVFPSRQSITPAARLLREFLKQKCEALLDELTQAGFIPPSR